MLSLWLLAQPLVTEHPTATASVSAHDRATLIDHQPDAHR
jgi:hypothetical protein